MAPVSQADFPIYTYLHDVFGRQELESISSFRTCVPDLGIRNWLNVRMMPAMVGKVEDGAEGEVSFIRPVSFDSIVDAAGIYWEGATESIDAVR